MEFYLDKIQNYKEGALEESMLSAYISHFATKIKIERMIEITEEFMKTKEFWNEAKRLKQENHVAMIAYGNQMVWGRGLLEAREKAKKEISCNLCEGITHFVDDATVF